ncbi:YncE family protein [Geothrix sp. PMB-07]|uniref:YncE family protein n=1 Tax=Geothrix sp. PMB-07 TaxID=3068640 RepID=UPI0027417E6A|nr:PQQ-binding-like beta-propeller repeat protein [Geothrix sp. PMB-07]WLT31589.1 PQQ-binding-like beta-propeller repeat protein [Geothrix sp. PMB-07]
MQRPWILCLTLLTAATLLHAQAKLPSFVSTTPIGGSGGWDYIAVNPENHHLYVSHATQMHVVDPSTHTVVTTIANTPGIHGTAFAPELSRAFLTCGGDNTVLVVDTKSFKRVATLKATGKKPDAALYEPTTKRVFIMNNGGDNITAFDAATLKTVGSIALGGAPEFAQADGQGRVFVNLEDKNAVAVIDAATLKVVAEWPLAPHATPTGMAIDVEHQRLFVGCRSKQLVVLDAASGKLLAALPIGAGVDACAFDPGTQRVFASCKDGTVAVIEAAVPDTYRVAGILKTEPGSKTMALDPSNHRIFVPAAGAKGTPGDPKAGFQVLMYE